MNKRPVETILRVDFFEWIRKIRRNAHIMDEFMETEEKVPAAQNETDEKTNVLKTTKTED